MPTNPFRRPRTALLLSLLAAAIAALVLLRLGGFLGAEAHGAVVVGIDMVPDGSNTGTTLGAIDPCLAQPNTLAATFTVDAFIDAVPAGQNLDGFNFPIGMAGTNDDADALIDEGASSGDPFNNPPPVQLADFDNNDVKATVANIINASDLSEGAPDKTSPHSEAVGLTNTRLAAAGTKGVLARYTLTVGVDNNTHTTVDNLAPDGLYYFTFNVFTLTGGLVSFLSQDGSDWGPGPEGSHLVTSFHDANHAPDQFGILALGVPCPGGATPTPTPTPTVTPTP